MRRTLGFGLALALVAGALPACSDRAATTGVASAEPIASTSAPAPTSSASAAAVAAPSGPRAAVVHAFAGDTRVYRLRRALLACTDGCATGTKDAASKAETFVVDRAGAKKEALFPEAAWRAQYGATSSIFAERRRVEFSGSHPEELWAHLDAPFDRGGYGYVVPLRAGAKGWEASNEGGPKRVGCYVTSGTRALVRDDGRCDDSGLSVTARKLLPALARSSEDPDRLVVLPRDGAVLLLPQGYARLVGEKWERRPAPWKEKPEAAVGLEDGRFVVSAAEGLFVVGGADEVSPVALVEGEGPEAKEIVGATAVALEPVGDEMWVRLVHDGKVKLAAPGVEAAWKRYLPPAPAPREKAAAVELPQPVNLTDACTTPFVMLASNDRPSYVFSASTEAFFGKTELQDAAFVQFTRDGSTYFGVQTKTQEQAKKAVELGKAAKLSPQLTCLDAVGSIPDPVNPPEGVRVYFVNLAHAATLWP